MADYGQPKSRDWSSSNRKEARPAGLEFNNLKKAPTEQDADHHEHALTNDATTAGGSSDMTRTTSSIQNTRSLLGLHPTAPIIEDHDMSEYSDLWWAKARLALREPLGEFFGVFIMVLFGDGSVAQVLLSQGETAAPGGNGFGAYQSISWG